MLQSLKMLDSPFSEAHLPHTYSSLTCFLSGLQVLNVLIQHGGESFSQRNANGSLLICLDDVAVLCLPHVLDHGQNNKAWGFTRSQFFSFSRKSKENGSDMGTIVCNYLSIPTNQFTNAVFPSSGKSVAKYHDESTVDLNVHVAIRRMFM